MKKTLLLLISVFSFAFAKAQLDDGCKAVDFTFTALNNNNQVVNLYSWLDSNYYVILDVSATWCGPCWSYHNTNALKDVYNQYGLGTAQNKVRVVFVEGDVSTPDAAMSGGSGSQGNWLLNTPYPMCNPTSAQMGSFLDDYEIGFFPTVYLICPDKTVKLIGQMSAADIWAQINPTPQCAPKINVDVVPWSFNGDYFSCDNKIEVKIDIRNRGFNNLTNATVNLKQGGIL
jgi:hypothetical protein